MLLKMRGGLDSIFVTILLGILIGSFAIFGIGPSTFTSGNQQVASVGDTPISTQTYYNRVQNRARALQAQYGAQFTVPQLISMMGLDRMILQQMISEAALKEHLSELGMRAGNAELRKELESYDGLVLPDGTLSREMVLQALNNTGLTRSEFLDQVRMDISRRQLFQTIAAEQSMPRELAEALHVWQAEKRRATMIDIKTDAIADIPVPAEGELEAYYEQNKGSYRSEERRSYNYILVTPQQFMSAIEVPEEQILEEYEARRDEYVRPEQRGLQQVSFADKPAADAFLVAVRAGGDFVEAGASVTSFTAEEIELGDFAKAEVERDYGEAAAEAIFGLELDGVTEPIEGFGGWNVFKVAAITEAEERTLDDVRAEVIDSLKEYQAESLLYEKVDEIADAMSEESELAAIAEKAGLALASVTEVNARGQNEAGIATATQAAEFTILREAFTKEVGQEADMVDIDPTDAAQGLYLVEVTEINEPADRAFEDVKSDITSAWTSEKKLERAAELAEEAKTRLQSGEAAEDIAVALNGTSFEAKNVARTGDTNSSLAFNIRRLIFDLKKGEIDFERASDGDGYVIVRVDETTPGDPSTQVTAVDTLLAQLDAQVADEVFFQYQSYLLENYKDEIKVNDALLQTLFTDAAQQ